MASRCLEANFYGLGLEGPGLGLGLESCIGNFLALTSNAKIIKLIIIIIIIIITN